MYGVLLRGCAKSSRFEMADVLVAEMHERGTPAERYLRVAQKDFDGSHRSQGGDGDCLRRRCGC